MRVVLPMVLYFLLGGLSLAADASGWLPKNPALFWTLGAVSVVLPMGLAILLVELSAH